VEGVVVAIGATLLTSSYDNVDRTSYTTASISPAANSLLLLFVVDSIAAGTSPRAVPTGLSLTWQSRGHQVFGASPATRRAGVWTAQCGASPGSGTITLTETDLGSGTTSTGTSWTVIEITGHHVSQPIRQVQYPRTGTFPTISGWSDASSTLPLLPAADSNSRPLAFFTHQQNEATTFRTNWTELSDVSSTDPVMGFEAQWRSGAFETTASATWASSSRHFGFALEIADASASNSTRAGIASYAETQGALTSSVSVEMPEGVTAGDLLIAYVSADANSTVAAGGGEGWTSITDASNGSAIRLKIFAKIAAGSDTLTLTVGASTDTATYVQRITNHDVSNVATEIEVGTPATGSSTTPDPPSVTPSTNREWLVMACAAADDDDNVITFSYHPTGYVPLAQTESSSATTSSMLDAACDVQTTGSAINPGSFSMANTEEWVTQTLLIPGGAINQAPVVNAGTNQSITFPGTATLAGSASDDGLPDPPDTLTTTWSKVSGPGTVTFGDASDPTTTATFSTVGVYVLRLTADDSELDTSDDIQITVGNVPLPAFELSVGVEVLWDDTNWVDITDDLREMTVRLPSRSRLQAVYQAGSATLVLDNRARKYDPLYDDGPFYGDLKANKFVRVSFGVEGDPALPVFTGWTDGWSFAYDRSNNDSTATITCIDALAKAAISAIPAGTTPPFTAGEKIATRGDALVFAAGVTGITYAAEAGYARFGTTWDATTRHNLLEELRRCAELEGAPLYALDDGTLQQEGRYWFATRALSATSNATIPSASLPCSEIRVLFDSRELVSAVSMSSETGLVATATNTAAVTEFGERYPDLKFDGMPAADLGTLEGAAATWVGLRGGEEMRFDTVTIQPQSSPDWWEHINERRPLDRVTVSLTPTGVGDPITQDAFIDGIEHHITTDTWVTTWHLLPADLYAAVDFFILGTDVLNGAKVLGY
jgi:hypothetical protein